MRKWKSYILSAFLSMFLLSAAPVLAENLYIDPGVTGIAGGTIDVVVKVSNAPNVVEAFGLDVTYDATLLEYVSNARGNLVAGYDFFDVNSTSSGVLRVGGFEAGTDTIPAGASGSIVVLTFNVLACPASDSPLGLQSLVDGFLSWTTANGSFVCAKEPCTFDVTPANRSVSSDGGNFCVSVTSNCDWTAKSDVSWLTITSGPSGSGDGEVCYSVAANTDSKQRVGNITVGDDTDSAVHEVVQAGEGCTLQVETRNIWHENNFTLQVFVVDAPNDVNSLQFDVEYDSTYLKYTGFSQGEIAADFWFYDNPYSAGVVNLAGVNTSGVIPAGASGVLINLEFKYKDDPATMSFKCAQTGICDGDAEVRLTNLKTDLAGWSSCVGGASPRCVPDGDVDGDGLVTSDDALLTLQHVVKIITLDKCQAEHADADRDDRVTTDDALCILRYVVKLPSCLK